MKGYMKTPQPEIIADVDEDAPFAELGEETPRRVRPRRPRGTLVAIVASALAGAVVGGALVFISVWKPAPDGSADGGAVTPGITPPPTETRGTPGNEWAAALASGRQLVAAGKLREAQEEYLAILLMEPTHDEAMRGLVRVVGLRARGDRAVLLRQAEAYRRAVSLDVETEEHYTAPAMELLARASLQAAGVRVSAAPPRPSPPPRVTPRPREDPAPAPRPRTRPTPEPPPAPRATPQPSAPAPRPTPAPQPSPPAQPAPPPPAAVNINEPFVTVVIGPVASSDQASAITGELTLAGYAARLRRQGAGSYVITLGPYRQSEAARAAGYVRSRFGQVAVSLTPAP